MGNCVSESDSLINEAPQTKFDSKHLYPSFNEICLDQQSSQNSISFNSSPDSAYPIIFRELMDVIAFKNKKFAIFSANQYYFGEINDNFSYNGKGKLYTITSDEKGNQKIIKFKGTFKNGKFCPSECTTPNCQIEDDLSEQKTMDTQENQSIVTSRYNQTLSKKDLNSISGQLTAKIIDGYIQYLQMLDEQLYWQTLAEKRERFQRTILFPSNSLARNCKILKSRVKQFGNVKFWLLFKKIGLVIQHSSNHWYFVEIRISEEEFNIIIHDSILCARQFYFRIKNQIKQVFEKLMNQSLEVILTIKQDCPQSYNDIDSGVYTCIFARMLRCNCRNKNNTITTLQMRDDLLKLFE